MPLADRRVGTAEPYRPHGIYSRDGLLAHSVMQNELVPYGFPNSFPNVVPDFLLDLLMGRVAFVCLGAAKALDLGL